MLLIFIALCVLTWIHTKILLPDEFNCFEQELKFSREKRISFSVCYDTVHVLMTL